MTPTKADNTWSRVIDITARIIAVLVAPILWGLWQQISAQTEAINELRTTVKASMAVESALAEERQTIKKAAHFHEAVGVTFCFPEVNR